MKSLIQFLSLENVNVRYVVIGVVLLGASTAVVGSFAFLRKKSLIGDAVAHSVLPGICLAFLFSQYKNPAILLIGAFTSGWLSILSIDYIGKKSRIKSDTAIALVLSIFFGVGILLLTYIQSTGNAAQSGLNNFLFGQAASLISEDVYTLAIICVLLVLVVFLFFKEFSLLSFDAIYARTIGLPVRILEIILSTLTVLAISVGIQAVGVVLMAAMLITPAAAARYWTNKLSYLVFIAAFFGAISGIFGSYISYVTPKMPTGPWIIMAITFIALVSLSFAPDRGFLFKWIKKKRKTKNTMDENVLKIFYHLGEQENEMTALRSIPELQQRRYFNEGQLRNSLYRLISQNKINEVDNQYQLTVIGLQEGQRIARLHRLWEMYMSKFLRMPSDHVHEGAESLEHYITPEMEAMLEEELNYPELDPHDKPIPYRKDSKHVI